MQIVAAVGATTFSVRRIATRGWVPVVWAIAAGLEVWLGQVAARGGWHKSETTIVLAAPILLASIVHTFTIVARHLRRRLERHRAEVAALLHDLRGPLLTARSYLDLLADGALGPLSVEAREAASRAAVAAARAQSLATALAPAAGRTQASETTNARVDLAVLLADVVSALHSEIVAAEASIELDTLPAVAGDHDALYRIFANLVENAVKYGSHTGGAPRVVVSAAREGDRWRIAVRDWGIGIPLGERARVFELRQRGTRTSGQPGHGLGLATVRSLVHLQGGSVHLAPEIIDGTCVEIILRAV